MRKAIVLVNTGTPAAPTPEAVGLYLAQFLSHPRIAPMAPAVWNQILKRFILPKRKVVSAAKYQIIWTKDGSPLILIQDLLAKNLEAAMKAKGEDIVVCSAMSFGEPSLFSTLEQLETQDFERIIIVPLYPQGAYSTSGIVEDEFRKATEELRPRATMVLTGDYWENELYLDAIARSIRNAGFGQRENDHLVISYHSVPRTDIANGDTYEETTVATTQEIVKRLDLTEEDYTLCYQCRFDKSRKWLSPFLAETLNALAKDNEVGRVFVVCPNFSIDCLETIYDIELKAKPEFIQTRALTQGLENPADIAALENDFIYIPCLNDSDAHVAALTNVLQEFLD